MRQSEHFSRGARIRIVDSGPDTGRTGVYLGVIPSDEMDATPLARIRLDGEHYLAFFPFECVESEA